MRDNAGAISEASRKTSRGERNFEGTTVGYAFSGEDLGSHPVPAVVTELCMSDGGTVNWITTYPTLAQCCRVCM